MSDYFVWDATQYGLQVPDMDREHETLIGLMNRVHSLHLERAPRAALGKALNELVAYTVRHFKDEEAYMAGIGYEGLRLHAGVHKQLLERVGVFAADFGRSGVLTDDFFAFLKMWLKAHICGIDIKYARSARVA